MTDMPRVQAIWNNDTFASALAAIEEAEQAREFCRHGAAHLLDVARVAWILNLERGLSLDRELIYAAALLHDIGRAAQYATGEPHDIAGVRMAKLVLAELAQAGVAFSTHEEEQIVEAICFHRGCGVQKDCAISTLAKLICEADHISRPCFACPVQADCYWSPARKNLSIRV